MSEPYFAYGSNLRDAQMRRLCPDHVFLSAARLDGYRLAFTLPDEEWAGGVADLLPCPGAAVWGALYLVSTADLAALDRYEGFDPQGPAERNAYERRRIEVSTADGTHHRGVWCYFVRQSEGHVPPSAAYRAALLEGAAERGLPSDYVRSMREAFNH